MRFSPGGKLLATGSDDGTVRLWDAATGSPEGSPMTGHNGPVWALRITPDGKRLITAGKDKQVRLWRVSTVTAPPAASGR
jgi:WD40 repeat protein